MKNRLIKFDIRFESDSENFIVTITLKKWDDVKDLEQDSKALKTMYDNIKGKEKGTVNITIGFASIKEIYDKQNK